jgi:uncharacterized protein
MVLKHRGIAIAAVWTVIFYLYPSQVSSGQTMTTEKYTNRLISEQSPYLLQHAHNPVDWYPWGEEAFEAAKKENKPVFLSIGYSTCHWCHVMEEESFENEEVAALLNEYFISVKVDREERPDIDSYYMTVAQMLTGSGGWPLSVMLTPDKEPFFAATYIPRRSLPGRAGMMELLPAAYNAWKDRKTDIMNSVDTIMNALESAISPDLSGAGISEDLHLAANRSLQTRFDAVNGGFGGAPKFPSVQNLIFLLRFWKRTGDEKALDMVERTLTGMRNGGIYDQVGFGFHRYSTDAQWHLPHFEKMLYDQAMISWAYLEAFEATGHVPFRQTAEEIFAYVLRDLRSPVGGFYTAEDADSEGEEGLFYLWSANELEGILGKEFGGIAEAFGITTPGNYVDEARRVQTGLNLFDRTDTLPPETWENLRMQLFSVREKRIHPFKDDKILTDWNGMMISALAKGGGVLGDDTYLNAARAAADFILETMVADDGSLLHRYRNGEASVQGHLDDYTFLVQGLIDLYQASFEVRYLSDAVRLTKKMIDLFLDSEEGGFYLSAEGANSLPFRQKESADGALPSGNSAAFGNLLRLGWLTGNTTFTEHALEIGGAFSQFIHQAPEGHSMMIGWHELVLSEPVEVIIVGNLNSKDTQAMVTALTKAYIPGMVVLVKSGDSGGTDELLSRTAPFTADYTMVGGKATAYVCRNFVCNLPTVTIEEMMTQIREAG